MNLKINYLTIYFKISIVLSLIYTVALWILLHKNIDIQIFITLFLLCIIPCISSLIMLLIGKHTSLKHPKSTKIAVNIINLSVFITHFCFTFIIFCFIWAFSDIDDPEYRDIKDYQKALKTYYPEAVEHFPKQIPQNAKNISMVKNPGGFLGDSDFYLKFDADNEYIQKEKFYLENKQISDIDNYDKERAARVLNYFLQEDDKNWDIAIIESSSCLRSAAIRGNTIIYMIYCD